MTKIVYNACYGGFDLSVAALERLKELGVDKSKYQIRQDVKRHDPRLVAVVEELGDKVNTWVSDIRIKEIKGDRYIIDEYDGFETVIEPDNINWIIVN